MKIIDKIFTDKKGSIVIYILLAAGIIMLTAGGSVFKQKEKMPPQNTQASQSATEDTEQRLEEILSQIDGAGTVCVMAVRENNGEKSFGYDTEGKQKKTVILNRSGNEEALISEESSPEIRGVIIVADGGGNGKVKEALTHAAQTVLGIPPHKIEVFERGNFQ